MKPIGMETLDGLHEAQENVLWVEAEVPESMKNLKLHPELDILTIICCTYRYHALQVWRKMTKVIWLKVVLSMCHGKIDAENAEMTLFRHFSSQTNRAKIFRCSRTNEKYINGKCEEFHYICLMNSVGTECWGLSSVRSELVESWKQLFNRWRTFSTKE